MNTVELFYEFPRIHTAIAEWIACIIYIMPRSKRTKGWKQWTVYCLFFVILLITNIANEKQKGALWLALMVLCMTEMFLMILASCKSGVWKTLYYWAHAFIAAEFAASLEWQINCYIIYGGLSLSYGQMYICMGIVYLVVFGILWFLNKQGNLMQNQPFISYKEAIGTAAIALVMFSLGNMVFAFQGSKMAQITGGGVLFVRTMSDLSGLVLLYAHDELRKEVALRYEVRSMNNLLNRQYEQFQMALVNNEAIKRIYHDLKHQIAFIKAETDEKKKDSYLSEMERVVAVHEATTNTGNSVLDTLLTNKNLLCVENGITMTCFAEASELERLDVMDICSIFGNALDNAIEYEKRIENKEQRLIKVTVFQRNKFLLLRIENYCEEQIPMRDGLPSSTKTDKSVHGYGIKSIRRAAEKYGGNLSITQEDGWFSLTVLIPIVENEN